MPFTDDFGGEASTVDLASHTPSGGTAWTRTGTVDSIRCRVSTDANVRMLNSTTAYYVCDDQGSANHYTQAKLVTLSSGLAEGFVASRLVDDDNLVGWYLNGTGSSGSRLAKIVSGTVTDLVTHQGAANSVYKVECDGSNVKLFEDGVQQGATQTVTDHQTETSQGLVNRAGNKTSGWLDDFEAGSLGGGDTNVSGNVEALTLTEYSASIAHDIDVSTAVEALSLTTNQASVTLDTEVSAGPEALTITTYSASLGSDNNVSANTEAINLSTNQATLSLDVDVSASAETLTLTTFPASVGAANEVSANAEALTLATNSASIAFDIDISTNVEAITVTTLQAGISGGAALQAAKVNGIAV